jgi:RNA polymerase sigma factor (sigma-70 family)
MKQVTFSQTALGRLMNDIRKVELLSIQEEIDLTTKIKEYQEFLLLVKAARDKLNLTLGKLITAIDIASELNMTLKEYNRMHSVGNFNRNKLIEANIRLVISIAKKYTNVSNNRFVNIQLTDLVQEGVFGLVRAAEKFEPTKGFKFSTYSCVPTSTQILTKRGWLNWDEIQQDDFTIGYNLETKQTEWTKVEKVTDYPDAPLLSIGDKRWSTLCTANHKWLMEDSEGVRLSPIEEWPTEKDVSKDNRELKLVLSAPFVGGNSPLTEDEASLLAWLSSDGYIQWDKNDKNKLLGGLIFQNENKFAEDIRALLTRLNAFTSELPHNSNPNCRKFWVKRTILHDLWEKANLYNRSLLDLVFDLTPSARKAFNNAWYKADGTQGRSNISDGNGLKLDALEISLFLEGKNCLSRDEKETYSRISWRDKLLTGRRCIVTNTQESGHVWCPSTELGTWTARDENGNIFLTGNTWWVKQAISKYISENNKPIRIPIHISDLINKIKYTTKELEIELGRPPSEKEIASKLGITIKRIRKAIEVSKPVISLDFTYLDQQDSTISSSLVERIKSPDMGPESSLEKEDLLKVIDILLEEIEEVDRDILISRFGLKGTKSTIADLATKHSISKEIVRKKEQGAIKYLKTRSVELTDFI